MSDERGMMNNGHDRIAGPVETMLKLHKHLPKAKPRMIMPAEG